MTGFSARIADLDVRLSATASLPIEQQGEAIASLFQQADVVGQGSIVALLIGEVVSLRERLPRPRPSPAAPSQLA